MVRTAERGQGRAAETVRSGPFYDNPLAVVHLIVRSSASAFTGTQNSIDTAYYLVDGTAECARDAAKFGVSGIAVRNEAEVAERW